MPRKRKVKKRDYVPITTAQQETFKQNGGYFIGGVAYMDCKQTGDPVPNVSVSSVSALGSRAVMHKCLGLLSDSERKRLFGVSKRGSASPRPRGWKWMKEFVDEQGNVYHKGIEQPKLKGTLKATDVAAIKAKQKMNKEKRAVAENKKLLKMAAEKKEMKKAIDKQKDFLNHDTK